MTTAEGFLLDIDGLRARTSPEFRVELYRQASQAGLDPSAIAAVMRVESGFDPAIRNRMGAPAQGLIQFWRDYFPSIARRAGRPDVRWEDIPRLSAVEQLPFVMAYYEGVGKLGPGSTPTDYYMATFLPSLVGAPPGFVLGRKGSDDKLSGTDLSLGKIYEQNAGLDGDRDGLITVRDVGRKVQRLIDQAALRPALDVEEEWRLWQLEASRPLVAAAWIVLAGAAWFLGRRLVLGGRP